MEVATGERSANMLLSFQLPYTYSLPRRIRRRPKKVDSYEDAGDSSPDPVLHKVREGWMVAICATLEIPKLKCYGSSTCVL